jgi:hypothetical protein
VEALLAELPDDNYTTVISVKQENMPSPTPNGQDASPATLNYDPAVAYILEFSTVLSTRDEDTVESTGKEVFDTLQSILRNSNQWHHVTVSRSAFYALKMLKASYVSNVLLTKGASTDTMFRIMISSMCHSCCTLFPACPRNCWLRHLLLCWPVWLCVSTSQALSGVR